MTVFADSSAVVKRYVDEEHSETIERLPMNVISAVCRVEVVAALGRKTRIGEITETEAAVLIREFEFDLAGNTEGEIRFVSVAVSGKLLGEAARLSIVHGLRSLDSIQLASALTARESDPECGDFLCFDKSLNRAAAAYGFSILSPS